MMNRKGMLMDNIREIEKLAYKMRKDTLRGIYNAGSGHPGGNFSCAEIIATLYSGIMRVDPKNPKWQDRDRLVLSKGHAGPILFTALASNGFFPMKECENIRSITSKLQCTPSLKVEGCDASAGSLGQGLSTAVGMALAGKADNKDYRVFVLMGDGEQDEGQIWEAVMAAAHHKLDNLIGIVDNNQVQMCGTIKDILDTGDLGNKYAAFGWNVIRIDGHDVKQIKEAIEAADKEKSKPTIIIATTVKGKGVSYMEGKYQWHGAAPNEEEYKIAMGELDNVINALGGE